jgi:hypothetical protein
MGDVAASATDINDVSDNLCEGRLLWALKFNKYCSTFVVFDKKFPILD